MEADGQPTVDMENWRRDEYAWVCGLEEASVVAGHGGGVALPSLQ